MGFLRRERGQGKGKDLREFQKRGKESSIVSISSLARGSSLGIDHEHLHTVTKRGELRVFRSEAKRKYALV